MVHFWLRQEYKSGERRTAIMPNAAKKLLEAGHSVTVEKFANRSVPDSEYEKVGCKMVEGNTWRDAPKDAFIIGLKELPNDDAFFAHRHIFFAHCYKYQDGWKDWLKKFADGGGSILDLEFLTDANGRRVAAFGRSAGFIGSAVGLMAWAHQQTADGQLLPGPLEYHENYDALVAYVNKLLDAAGKRPSMHIVGALGRCGRGATEMAERAGVEPIVKWDMAETAKGGPFPELLNVEVLLNAILLNADDPPPAFVKPEMLDVDSRKTTVLVDVSCDGTNPTNPVPLYSEGTTFIVPASRVRESEKSASKKPFDVVAIDHLPSLVPAESSAEFCDALLPHLLSLTEDKYTDVWQRAEDLYHKKVTEAGFSVKKSKNE